MEQRTRARELRRDATPAERRLWRRLSARQVAGTRFNRQVPIGPFICDFVARTPRLVVEVDGGQHAWQVDQDEVRTAYLHREGYAVLRFWNNDVIERLDGVVAEIERVLARPPSPDPSRDAGGEIAG